MNSIRFNIPFVTGKETSNFETLISKAKFSGDGYYTKKSVEQLRRITDSKNILLTSSCTHALETAAISLDIQKGDEVIMPSFTFTSTANAFVLRGAKIVFVDVRPETMNVDEREIEKAVTRKTKAIIPMHYAGVACKMNEINAIAKANKLYVVEDAAQCVSSSYNDKHLGTLGDFGCFSFHDTKNIHCGEGGALLVNNEDFFSMSEVVREKGTNRTKFINGEVDKYSWIDVGSSYLLSEINAAFLSAQLDHLDSINSHRSNIWNKYFLGLQDLEQKEKIKLPHIPEQCASNYHIFFIKVKDIEERSSLIDFLNKENIQTYFHYLPLHTSIAGKKFGSFNGQDVHTTKESERLLRLPLHMQMQGKDVEKVISMLTDFYKS